MSANGTFSRRSPMEGVQKEQQLASLRDVAVVITVACGLAMYFVEPAINPHAISWEPVYRQLKGDWKTLHYHRTVQQCLLMIFVNVLVNSLSFFMVSRPFSNYLLTLVCHPMKLEIPLGTLYMLAIMGGGSTRL